MRRCRLLIFVLGVAALAACDTDTSRDAQAPQRADGEGAQTMAAEGALSKTDAPSRDADLSPAERAMFYDPVIARTAKTISGERIREVVAEIASDAYGGRGPGSAGDEMTQTYLSDALARHGFEPAAPGGGWLQPFELVSIDSKQPAQWRFEHDNEALTLRQHEQFIAGSGIQAKRAALQGAELVFVGYGIEAPEYDWDDFAGADLSGKVLVMLNNDPDWDDDLFAGNRRLFYGRWTYKYESAARQGAAGAIIIHTTPSAGYGWQVIQSSWTGPQFELPARPDEPRLQVAAWVTEDSARELLALGGHDLDALVSAARSRAFEPVPLGIETSIEFDVELQRTRSANVIGRLPGSDPDLKDEVVVYTAHHDHLGTIAAAAAEPGADRIYNGARDNASGVGMVLEIARAFATLETPPRRSIMVAYVGAEEQGLLGSRYFGQNPPVPPGRIAANINIDSGNIWGPTQDITFIGKGKSSLDAIVDKVGDYFGRAVKPDQFPDRGSFYRSDQFNLARIGVPAFYLNSGTEFVGRPDGWGTEVMSAYSASHYHQVSDELTEDWDLDGMRNDAEFAFWVGLLVANADAMPSWYPGDEFEAARKSALEALR